MDSERSTVLTGNQAVPAQNEDGDESMNTNHNHDEQNSHDHAVGAEDEEEKNHFENILRVFRQYGPSALQQIQRDYLVYSALPQRQRQMLHPSFPKHLTQMKHCAAVNAGLLKHIIAGVGGMFENADHKHDVQQSASNSSPVSPFQMDKLYSALRQVSRDWSSDGAAERAQCYGPVIETLETLFPDNVPDKPRYDVKVLVPGAGLGRLAWQLANAGFTCQGNEFSLHMLFMSNYILNGALKVNSLVVYPWLHQRTNNLTYADQLHAVHFPDVDTTTLPKDPPRFSMAAGEFVEVYSREPNSWDVVATVFFLDTAQNVLDYLECIYDILKPGGVWVNLGPLLYHFADSDDNQSLELPYEEIRRLVEKVGFKVEKEATGLDTNYALNERSMLHHNYKSAFLQCRKPLGMEGT